MAWQDYREYIKALEETGDAVRVTDEVDWDLEMGAITRRGCEKNGPAPLFENIKGYPGCRAYGNPFATYRRFAVAFGLPPEASFEAICNTYEERSKRRIKPVIVDEQFAPCKDNKLLGDDADLHALPVPMVHDGDGGRYVGTWHIMAAKDLESDWINWGMYRAMMCR